MKTCTLRRCARFIAQTLACILEKNLIHRLIILTLVVTLTVLNTIGQQNVISDIALTTDLEGKFSADYYHPNLLNYDSLGIISFDSVYTIAVYQHKIFKKKLSGATIAFSDSPPSQIWELRAWKRTLFTSRYNWSYTLTVNASNGKVIEFEETKRYKVNVNV